MTRKFELDMEGTGKNYSEFFDLVSAFSFFLRMDLLMVNESADIIKRMRGLLERIDAEVRALARVVLLDVELH